MFLFKILLVVYCELFRGLNEIKYFVIDNEIKYFVIDNFLY